MYSDHNEENPFFNLIVDDSCANESGANVTNQKSQQSQRSRQDIIQTYLQEAKKERQQGALGNENQKGK